MTWSVIKLKCIGSHVHQTANNSIWNISTFLKHSFMANKFVHPSIPSSITTYPSLILQERQEPIPVASLKGRIHAGQVFSSLQDPWLGVETRYFLLWATMLNNALLCQNWWGIYQFWHVCIYGFSAHGNAGYLMIINMLPNLLWVLLHHIVWMKTESDTFSFLTTLRSKIGLHLLQYLLKHTS